jgi:hypothetical protein
MYSEYTINLYLCQDNLNDRVFLVVLGRVLVGQQDQLQEESLVQQGLVRQLVLLEEQKVNQVIFLEQ